MADTSLNPLQDVSITGLNILVVGPLYGGSLSIATYVTNALSKLGHKSVLLDNSVFNSGRIVLEQISRNRKIVSQLVADYLQIITQGVYAKAIDMGAQIVFFLAQAPGTPQLLENLRQAGIPTAFWFVEDAQLFDYGLKIAPFYDVFFHIQQGWFEKKLKNVGARVIHYLPLAADPQIHKPLSLTEEQRRYYGSDLSHVGSGYYNRRCFFANLTDYNFKIWGDNWDNASLLQKSIQHHGTRKSTEEMAIIFNASKINLNLHSSSFCEGINPNGDFVNPRTFEIAACGNFQLTDERQLLPDLFEPGVEIAVFHDLTSCRNAIDFYLSHPEQARCIAEAGRGKVLRAHTYVHRMREACSVICAKCRIPHPPPSVNAVESLVAEAKDNVALTGLFKRCGLPHEEMTLDTIAAKIASERIQGDTEATFVLMKAMLQWAKDKGAL